MQVLNSVLQHIDEMWFLLLYGLRPSFLALVPLDIVSYSGEVSE